MFVAVPGICLLISLLYSASVAGGVIVTLLFLAAVGGLIFWWVKLGGCYKVVSLEDGALIGGAHLSPFGV